MKKLFFVILLCGLCQAFSPTFSTFTGGQVGPLLDARVGFLGYQSSCRTLQNMFVTTQGPAVRRPGTKYIATQKDSTAVGRLIPYEHSVEDAYILLFEYQVLRFFRDGAQVLAGGGTEDISGLDNVIAHWKMNDDAASTAVDDNVGVVPHDGTASSNTEDLTTAGIVNAALDFTGDETVDVADHAAFSFRTGADTDLPFSIAGWVVAKNGGTQKMIISKWKVGGSQEYQFFTDADNKLVFRTTDEGNRATITTDEGLSETWHFVCSTYAGQTGSGSTAANFMKLYVDGVEVTDVTRTTSASYEAMHNSDTKVVIGGRATTGNNDGFWLDKIDNLFMTSDVLTPAEVAGLYSLAPYEIETPYATADLGGLDYVKSEEVMFIVHADHEPRQLTRIGHALWTLTAIQTDDGPFQSENIDTDLTITPSAATGDITLTAASSLFNSGHVNSIWRIEQVRGTSQVTGTFTANGTSLSTPSFSGGYGFTTSGNSDGTITLQRSTNNGASWRAALTALTDTDFDNPAENEEDGAIYRIVMSNYGGGTVTYTFTITDNLNKGVVRITGISSGTVATAEVLTDLVGTTATSNWREGYWSDYRGWPETVTIHQQRLVFGASASFPQTLWFGKTDPDDYTNFTEGTLDTSAFTVVLAGNNPVQWMISQDSLLIGSSGSCGKWGEPGKAVTPTSPSYQDQTPHGSAAIKGVRGGENILYAERGARNIRGFGYNFAQDKFLSSDLTVLSPEITESGIKEMAFQRRPEPILWCVLNNGGIATFTYQRDQNVAAWSKQVTDGNFESIAIIPSATGTEDQVWVLAERTIDSNSVRYVELFQPRNWGSDPNDAWFVDSGISYDGGDANTFGGAYHLEAETVSIYADRLIESPEVVSSGSFTIDNDAARVLVGMAYTSKLETLPLVIDPQDKAMDKRIMSVWFDLYKTGYMEFGGDSTATLINMDFNNNLDLDNTATAQDFVTSTVKLKRGSWSWGSKMKQTVYVESDQPMPLTIRGITTSFNVRKP